MLFDSVIPLFALTIYYILLSSEFLYKFSDGWFRKLMTNNIFAQYCALFMTIFLFVIHSDFNKQGVSLHPVELLWHTIIVFVLFLVMSRIHIYFIIPIFILILILITLYTLNNHYSTMSMANMRPKYNTILVNAELKIVKHYETIKKYMMYSIYIICALGYIHYFIVNLKHKSK